MTRLLLSALLASALAVNGAAVAQYVKPKLGQCSAAGQMVAAEALNRGSDLHSSRIFFDADAKWLSREIGMALPGSSWVVLFSYSNGSLGVLSFVGLPECWRLQILERR